jgi:predicted esterase
MITTHKLAVEGVFGRKEIPVELYVNHKNESRRLYILLHGAYGKAYHHQPTKYQILSELLAKQHSVGFYQTSRNFMQMERPELNYDEYRNQSFGGKQFADEWEDVQRGVEAIIKSYTLKKGKPKEIICIGFSMGGLWSCLLTQKYKEISKIYAFGSGTKFNLPSSFPLFESFPKVSFFRAVLSKYRGELHVIHGSNDELTSEKSAFSLFKLAIISSIKSYHEWLGVDHQFVCVNGENREAELIESIVKMIDN